MANKPKKPTVKKLTCDFCGATEDDVDTLISNGDVNICNECVESIFMTLCDRERAKMQKLGIKTPEDALRAAKEYLISNNVDSDIVDSLDFDDDEDDWDDYENDDIEEGPGIARTIDLNDYTSFDDEVEREMKAHPLDVKKMLGDLPTPRMLFEKLGDYVVGQDESKRAMAVSMYNHYKRILMGHNNKTSAVEIAKSNVLLLGPTGSGKTLLAQSMARILKVPFAIADATTLTEAGYVGEDVENILLKLIIAADYDIQKAQLGIIYVDEIDKIATKAENLSVTRDVSGEGVQQALLKIVEGCNASVPPQGGRKHPGQEMIHINTENILFIFGGAFVGLSDIIGRRVGKKSLGFASETPTSKTKDESKLLDQCTPEDLQTFGLIPEFVGRVPIICNLKELTVDDLVRVLTEPKNALVKQFVEMFKFENCKLVFEKDALKQIASEAKDRGTGARGLRSILERVLSDVMFDLPEIPGKTKVVVRKSDVLGETSPDIIDEVLPAKLKNSGAEGVRNGVSNSSSQAKAQGSAEATSLRNDSDPSSARSHTKKTSSDARNFAKNAESDTSI